MLYPDVLERPAVKTAPRYRPPVDFGLGTVAIGNEFQFATDEQAEATLAAAWNAGVRYFDVSPWYGLGLAERRFGRFLSRKPRGEFTLSSKVIKLLLHDWETLFGVAKKG